MPIGVLLLGNSMLAGLIESFRDASRECAKFEAVLGLARLHSTKRIQDVLLKSVHLGPPDVYGLRLTTTSAGKYWEPARAEGTIVVPQLAELSEKYRWRLTPPIRRGDIVLDCGANIGTFTREALNRGAQKVIAFEPAAENIECFHRNLRDEIASGKVVLVERGVWNESGTLRFFLDAANSAQSSFVPEKGRPIRSVVEVPVTTIDAMVEQLSLQRVNMIKMDIEGSEPQALKGAALTLRRFRPRLEMEASAGTELLIGLAQQAWPGYRAECLVCMLT